MVNHECGVSNRIIEILFRCSFVEKTFETFINTVKNKSFVQSNLYQNFTILKFSIFIKHRSAFVHWKVYRA